MELFSVSCTRRSHGPAERAAGPIRSVSEYQIMVFRQGKTPLGSGESTRATSNDVSFRDLKEMVSRLRTDNLARGSTEKYQ